MTLILLNSQSNQQITLDSENPLIIGRNNVVGCFDKKVSRSHGRITCTENGKINLVALHSNPCFFMKNGVPPIRQLNKNEEETLNEGDCLGLLPNSFWFQILSNNDLKIKKEPEEPSSESWMHSESEKVKLNNTDGVGKENREFSTAGSSEYIKRLGSPEFEKTRRLPLSMYDTDDLLETDRCLSTVNDDAKNKKLKLDGNGAEVVMDNDGTNKEDNSSREKPSTSKISLNESIKGNSKIEEEIITLEEEGTAGKTEVDKSSRKPICKYEQNCFRKNTQHKIDFCHPGDPDYVPYEKRPFCPFGAECYRRNERHRVEFRHAHAGSSKSRSDSTLPRPSSVGEERPPCFSGSFCVNRHPRHRKDFYHPPKASSPLPPKRRRKKVKRNSDYEDEYDLEDPFINDASSDEYIPSDLDSEDWDDSQET